MRPLLEVLQELRCRLHNNFSRLFNAPEQPDTRAPLLRSLQVESKADWLSWLDVSPNPEARADTAHGTSISQAGRQRRMGAKALRRLPGRKGETGGRRGQGKDNQIAISFRRSRQSSFFFAFTCLSLRGAIFDYFVNHLYNEFILRFALSLSILRFLLYLLL